MNTNTIAYAPRLPGAAQGASSTAEFQFKDADGNNAVITVRAGLLNKKRFRIRAGGRVTGGTTTNFTAYLHVGAALNTNFFSSGALAVDSASGSFLVEVDCVVDSTGDKIVGTGTGGINATMVTVAVAAAAADPETALSFSISGTFSASHANSAAYLDFFELEVL